MKELIDELLKESPSPERDRRLFQLSQIFLAGALGVCPYEATAVRLAFP